jgi:aldose 1-epimerase
MDFSYTVDESKNYGPLVTLRYGAIYEKGYRSASVAPRLGSNLYRFVADGFDILQYDIVDPKKVSMGNPLLYPTPNRVRDCQFTFGGEVYKQVKHGEPKFIHGLVQDEPWQFSEPVLSATSVKLATWLDITPAFDGFSGFPFAHRLSVDYELGKTGVKITYKVQNKSGKQLPFGFGMHPYFNKLSGESGTTLSVPAQSVFEREDNCLPTGKILPVAGTKYDLRTPKAVGSLDLDDVFTEMAGDAALIGFSAQNLTLLLKFTGDFGRMVVFTPTGKSYFCAENQTCSTDAHNLYAKGLEKESGLIVVEPGGECSGSVLFEVVEG